jgi:hypothetical protein
MIRGKALKPRKTKETCRNWEAKKDSKRHWVWSLQDKIVPWPMSGLKTQMWAWQIMALVSWVNSRQKLLKQTPLTMQRRSNMTTTTSLWPSLSIVCRCSIKLKSSLTLNNSLQLWTRIQSWSPLPLWSTWFQTWRTTLLRWVSLWSLASLQPDWSPSARAASWCRLMASCSPRVHPRFCVTLLSNRGSVMSKWVRRVVPWAIHIRVVNTRVDMSFHLWAKAISLSPSKRSPLTRSSLLDRRRPSSWVLACKWLTTQRASFWQQGRTLRQSLRLSEWFKELSIPMARRLSRWIWLLESWAKIEDQTVKEKYRRT